MNNMYNNHHKRMVPKREDAYRTEFPGYYSSSSVYSYSPTSNSDCPEHGRNRKRTTLILVTSVVLATLAVLSIAGIAAYLGIISKNISNNASSQYEESYLQSNSSRSNSRALESEEEEDVFYSHHGRSKDDPGFIDLTNSLSDIHTGLESVGNDELLSHRRREPEIVADTDVKYKEVTRAPDIIRGVKMTNSQPLDITAKPITLITKSKSTTPSTTTTSSSVPTSTKDGIIRQVDYNNRYNYNPVDMIFPPHGQANDVTYFTEEPTTPRTSTNKLFSRNERNRSRKPMGSTTPTPSHNTSTLDVDPSRMTNFSMNLDNSSFVPSPPSILSQLTSTMRTASTGKDKESPSVHVTPLDAIIKGTKATTEGVQPDQRHFDESQRQNAMFSKRFGLGEVDVEEEEDSTLRSSSHKVHNEENENDPQKTTHHMKGANHFKFGSTDKGEEVSIVGMPNPDSTKEMMMRPQQPVEPFGGQFDADAFVPFTPMVGSSGEQSGEGQDRELLLNNHKMPLSFDKVSPGFYDKNPWTPLLDRPNLDKRPRVDIIKPSHSEEQGGSVTSTSTTDNTWSVISTPSKAFDNYGHRDDESHSSTRSKIHYRNQMAKPNLEFDDKSRNGPISHGLQAHSSTTANNRSSGDDDMQKQVQNSYSNDNVNGTRKGAIELESFVEETAGGFRPLAIPAYTVMIPHIPNPPPRNNLQSQQHTNDGKTNGLINSGEILRQEQHKKNHTNDDNVGEDRYSSFKYDKVGLMEAEQDDNAGSAESSDSLEMEDDARMHDSSGEDSQNNDHEKKQAEDIKEEDYGDNENEELTGDNPSPTKIYSLDPESVDIVPDTLGGGDMSQKIHSIESQDLTKSSFLPHDHALGEKSTKNATINEATTLKVPDPFMKSTTDLIMSTLGSLNLIKPSKGDASTSTELDSKLRASDVNKEASQEAFESEESSSESPLFPPVRSYVGINLPLRPRPSPFDESSGSSGSTNKRPRGNTKDGMMEDVPMLRPDLNTVSSLQQVLSMMMKFEGEAEGRDLKDGGITAVNVTKQNVNLLIAGDQDKVHKAATGHSDTDNHRGQKSLNNYNRHSKIDEQFVSPGNIAHVPIPLIPPANKSQTPVEAFSSKFKLTNVTINNQNSPVYKFVLRQGQSIEDLLKEIFNNYTEVLGNTPDVSVTEGSDAVHVRPSLSHSAPSAPYPSLKSLDNDSSSNETVNKSSVGVTFANIKINHHEDEIVTTVLPETTQVPTTTTTTIAPVPQTVTSIVVNQSEVVTVTEQGPTDDCPKNSTFRCVSTGKCLPSYLRCNFIKECPDNSDEENCFCADFLRANGNGRKLCDGVVDCSDVSDEYLYCDYCKAGQYICAGSRTCINKTQICDSHRDCPNGDDENDCVKIGEGNENPEAEEFSSIYRKNGHLMVRKKGVWGKLCVETFSSVVSHWEVKDLAKAVCKALTFSDFETVERKEDRVVNNTGPYYELFYGVANNSDTSDEGDERGSSELPAPRVGLGFKKTECKSKLVINVTCKDLQCGTAPKSFTQTARIVGGANSMPGKWPWQAALYKNGEYQCGATLISSRWLLSAGHCFYNAQDDYWVARLGTLRRGATVLSPYEQVVRITHVFLHPQYQNVGFVNDVSLLRLEKEVNFTDYVRPACLPPADAKIRDGKLCSVIGWGQLFESSRIFPDTLQEVQPPLISTAECRKRTLFLPLYKLTDQMFCAGFDRGGRDACLGDSGGPMMCQETDGRWSLYGVTSNGYGCARANRPGVYTKVASYLGWINQKMSLDNSLVFREKPKHCAGHRCLLGECLDKRQVCNGIVDCIEDNGSDERGPNCTTHLGVIT